MSLKKYMNCCLLIVTGLLLILPAGQIWADNIIDFDNLRDGDLAVDGFELNSKTTLNLFAIGAEVKRTDDMFAYAWILESDTREPVWVMQDENVRTSKGSEHILEYEGELTLPSGRYEAYYYVGRPYLFGSKNIQIDNLSEAFTILEKLFDGDIDDYEFYEEHIDEITFQIEGPEGSFTKFNPANIKNNAVVNFQRPENDFNEQKGFTLKKDMTLNINAIGEYDANNRIFVDLGWIINADTREKVWKMDKWNTSWFGGGRKNRGFNGEVDLTAGNYIAHFVTDDSHTFGEWNVMPPYDPLNYGMTISATNKSDAKNIEQFVDDYSEPVIVSMTRIRDNEFKSQGFTLTKDADLHIIALGEYGYSDDFVDYGWIENLEDEDIVWQMTEDNTEYAGGGMKNRKFDGIVSLPAGSYMIHYTSDDSHSYRDWNVTAPYDKKMWGITVNGTGKNFDPKIVKLFKNAPENSNVIASLTGIGDNAEETVEVSLDKTQKVRIYALGEGDNGSMYDYGWIENSDNGDIIWEMTYRKTRHAGGARKNRQVDTEILLEAGDYELYFVTDGSHSFPDFNSSRPKKAHKWGITLYKSK